MSDAHEKTRIRQLEDAAAHWEHKYTNARQYNRNIEERIRELEAENARLNMEMAAYRQGCTAKDAAAMFACVDALTAEKLRRAEGSPPSDATVNRASKP